MAEDERVGELPLAAPLRGRAAAFPGETTGVSFGSAVLGDTVAEVGVVLRAKAEDSVSEASRVVEVEEEVVIEVKRGESSSSFLARVMDEGRVEGVGKGSWEEVRSVVEEEEGDTEGNSEGGSEFP